MFNFREMRLKPLIERYAMLNNLRPELLVDGGSKSFGEYNANAFKKTYPEVTMKISHAADYCCSYGYEIIKWAGYWAGATSVLYV